MIEASADVVLGEAIRPAAEAQSRVYGGGIGIILLCALTFGTVAALGPWVGLWLNFAIGGWGDLVAILFLIGAGIGAVAMYARLHQREFLKSLRKIGSPGILRTRFCFDEHRIAIDTDRISYRVPWSSILLVASTPTHWLLQVDTTTLAIPKRAFASPSDEQAFVELAKTSISEAARGRSDFEN